MKLAVSMQGQLWRELELPGPGYNVTEILDSIESAKKIGELGWIDWNQPLRLDIQVVE